MASPGTEFEPARSRKFPFSYNLDNFENDSVILEVASHLCLPASAQDKLACLVQALWEIFREKEAFVLETRIGLSSEGHLEVHGAHFGFDDAAYRSSGRQEEIHSLRNKAEEVPEEVEAEKDGIVYITYDHNTPRHLRIVLIISRLQGKGSIGTLGMYRVPPSSLLSR